MTRQELIALQVVGGLTILAYPFVLVANIMSIAATGQTRAGALPWILLSAYPLVWIVLYVVSWRAMARGAVRLAFGLSSIPLLAGLSVVGFIAFSWMAAPMTLKSTLLGVQEKMQAANPLLWTIWSTGGEHRFPATSPAVRVDEAIRAIGENPARVNIGLAPYGTPLKIAVDNLALNYDGSPIGDADRQRDPIRVVRALVAHGARFSPAEAADLGLEWRLRRALHEGPIATATENPLVWRILTRKRDGVTVFTLAQDEAALVNTPTALHGTPLYAALVEEAPDACRAVVQAGGRLSAEEQRNPAPAAALAKALEQSPDLRAAYTKAR